MKIWHISDTHAYHHLLEVPKNIDIVIHSGDASNYRDTILNLGEFNSFIDWFKELPIPHKVYVAGNHDSSLEIGFFKPEDFENAGITYLSDKGVYINGVYIYGSPYTPAFGNWCFMKSRDKIYKVWNNIPDFTDILVTHGPPMGVLDLTYNRDNELERVGDRNLLSQVLKRNIKYHLFGHVHNCQDIINAGYQKLSASNTIFSNGSVVTDGKFGKVSSNGNLFEI